MKNLGLSILIFLSCNNKNGDIKNTQQSAVVKNDTINRYTGKSDPGIKEDSIYESDTAIIDLKKLNVLLLDIRYSNQNTRALLIKENNVIKDKIDIPTPTQEDIQGFAVNWIKEIEKGFEISIEYGSRYYRQKDFRFSFKDGSFYLSTIKVSEFDKKNTDDYKIYTEKYPDIPINKFNINEYIK